MARRPIQFGGAPVRLTRAQHAVAERAGASPFGATVDAVTGAQVGAEAQHAAQQQQPPASPIFKIGVYSAVAYLLLTRFVIPWWEDKG